MIEHLNRGREIAGEDLIEPFELRPLPSAVEMSRAGTSPNDYFDSSIVEHWDVLVGAEVESYLTDYLQ